AIDLVFRLTALCHRVLCVGLKVEETRPPVRREFPGADRSASESSGVNHGSRNATRAETGPRASGFLGRKRCSVKQKSLISGLNLARDRRLREPLVRLRPPGPVLARFAGDWPAIRLRF